MAEVAESKKAVSVPAESLLSKRRKKIITDPLDDDNPVTIQVLGICSALAVTVKLEPYYGYVNCRGFCLCICEPYYFFN